MKNKIPLLTILLFITYFICENRIIYAQNLQWVKNLGGANYEIGQSIAVDATGNVYTTGYFTGTIDLNPGAGTYTVTSKGQKDIFISKLDASGNFVWAGTIGGITDDEGLSITLDTSGNIYTTGHFYGTVDFDPGIGTSFLTSGSNDIFILKLDAAGVFQWAKNMLGTTGNYGYSIKVDNPGYIYITGLFYGTVDFDPGGGTYNLTSAAHSDVFISKLDALGNFVWAKSLGGTDYDIGYSIAIDGSGNIYTTGIFSLTADFDPGAGTYNLTSTGGIEIFISKLDASGNFIWAKRLGGTGADFGKSITFDASANIYITGGFSSTVDFDPGTSISNLTSTGLADIFVVKLDSSGNFIWAKGMGGTSSDIGNSIALGVSANIFITGNFEVTADFDPAAGTSNLSSSGDADIFISKLDSSGNFVWAKGMGGIGSDGGLSIALDASENIYTTGWFSATVDFDPNGGVDTIVSAGVYDVFILKLSTPPTIINQLNSNNEENISIYPNPNNGIFTIKTDNQTATISIINILGEVIYESKALRNQIEIDLSNLAQGLYNIRLISPQNIVVKRVLIQ